METRVKVCANENCCGIQADRPMFPQLLRPSSPKLCNTGLEKCKTRKSFERKYEEVAWTKDKMGNS